MNRRTLLASALSSAALSSAAVVALSGPAHGRSRRPPRIRLLIQGTLTHRRKPVTQRKVSMRFAMFPSPTAKDPVWSQIVEQDMRDGVVDLELGQRSLGTTESNDFPEEVWLEVRVLRLGDDVEDLKLAPRLHLPWSEDARPSCFEADESLSVSDEGSCLVAGTGAVTLTLSELRRDPAGDWTPGP